MTTVALFPYSKKNKTLIDDADLTAYNYSCESGFDNTFSQPKRLDSHNHRSMTCGKRTDLLRCLQGSILKCAALQADDFLVS